MPTSVEWIIEERVLQLSIYCTLSIDELQDVSKLVAAFIRHSREPVHLIIVLHNLEKSPLDITALRKATVFFREPNLGWVVQVGGNRLLNFLASAVSQLENARLHNVSRHEEAIAFLLKKDETLAQETIPNHLP